MASAPRILAIMGSGETAPTMVSVHQELFALLAPSASAVLVDTPYGFQENADEISQRTIAYFGRNVGRAVEPVGLRTTGGDEPGDAPAIARLQAADFVFAGPGSPTYALDRWRGSAFADALAAKLRGEGIVVFASAAAVGLGRYAVPVYEIYKVGLQPRWVDGLDLMAHAGLDAAVIPHFDNAEGGTHDTRFCYLGARRLHMMERQLDAGTYVVGVDEHTALILDLAAGVATVRGRGQVTIRRAGRVLRTVPAGTRAPLEELTRDAGAVAPVAMPGRNDRTGAGAAVAEQEAARTLTEQVAQALSAFDAALATGDAEAVTSTILDLEETIAGWSADTTQTDDADRARAALRGLIVRLGAVAAEGLADPAARIAPFADVVVHTRTALRARGEYELADRLRAAAGAAGLELRDSPDGTTWHLVTD